MIEYMIPLVVSWLPMWQAYVLPCFCLCVVAFAGRFIHYVLRGFSNV